MHAFFLVLVFYVNKTTQEILYYNVYYRKVYIKYSISYDIITLHKFYICDWLGTVKKKIHKCLVLHNFSPKYIRDH